ncbi:HI1506-related protein [Laribacter hongkongensis]|uniref:HI1506-related protein n=1 Tax=Laribacter hongkongensis TaxID=168471 RepID=UPI001EFCFAE4|nr:HI1506-related protein [Laribacter hongkongensis]MCG9031615.1 hypothetical protein [Laribacter hongkongensis]MCG9093120.1 hypothetical protein [Laribacter hongkongensis]
MAVAKKPAATPKGDAPGAPDVVAVQVRALTERFRRAGREFTREPVMIPRDELSDAELKQLLDEPLLAVEIVTGEV